MPRDRVHAEAEVLEHYISEDLEALIAAKLGEPSHDPHGNPIPGPDLDAARRRPRERRRSTPRSRSRAGAARRGRRRRSRPPLARRPRAAASPASGPSSARPSSPPSPTSTPATSPPTSPAAPSSATCCSGSSSPPTWSRCWSRRSRRSSASPPARTSPSSAANASRRRTSIGLWLQAEVVAMACDLAEIVGAALGLNLLFGIPLFVAGLIAGVGTFTLLALQRRGFRQLEAAITRPRRRRRRLLRLRALRRLAGRRRSRPATSSSPASPAPTASCWRPGSSARR